MLLGSAFGDDLRLLDARVFQIGAPRLHLVPELLDLREDSRVLTGDPLDRVQARDDVVEALGSEQHLQRRVAVAVHVQVPQALGDTALRDVQALTGSDQVARIRVELAVDTVELHVRVVVRLDRRGKAHVELLELGDDRLRLSLFGLDSGIGRRRTGSKQQPRGQCREENDSRRPSGSRAPELDLASTPDGPAGGGLARHKSGTLAPPPDACNPQQN